ncbi:uncharacterized protein LOC119983847 isoform X2 [Tripterygium wilfordii]|uniref:uncharacterized protein LOC119983847 isoform X2 n=1 Tax=Tripterygium wilfordii TaxID=458696 RepID=UPI0018F801BE|nr:uncharacterized protein LOC119983847 isoform X2 [Tripterygium wilfordii]
MEYARWLEEDHQYMSELHTALRDIYWKGKQEPYSHTSLHKCQHSSSTCSSKTEGMIWKFFICDLRWLVPIRISLGRRLKTTRLSKLLLSFKLSLPQRDLAASSLLTLYSHVWQVPSSLCTLACGCIYLQILCTCQRKGSKHLKSGACTCFYFA